MTDIIRLLPDSVANQIAAGEVIQRPASAVKELLENAVDSGATEITLIIKDAGKALIQVVDNGSGMTFSDTRMSIERHATSKIQKAEDLFQIKSKGFRGEALASIAAIAQVEIKTKRHENEVGTLLKIEGSKVGAHESTAGQNGTSIAVKNLFYNTPARRNFLKTNASETRHILEEFHRVALAHPEISMSLIQEGNEVYVLKPSNFRQRIATLMGKNYNERLVPVHEETTIVNVSGFIGKPEYARKSRGEQYFFANRRFIRDPYLNHAVLNAFEGLLPSGSYPSYFINIEIDPSKIDVNIHPTKTEIKFEDEKSVYSIIRAAVKRALGKFSVAPSLDFEQESSFSIPVSRYNSPPVVPKIAVNPAYNPFETGSVKTASPATLNRPKVEPATNEQLFVNPEEIGSIPSFKVIGQVGLKYILCYSEELTILIDQSAAHERILYEEFNTKMELRAPASQQDLFPVVLDFSQQDYMILNDILPELKKSGFELEPFGKNSFVISGMPAFIKKGKEKSMIEDIIERYRINTPDLKGNVTENVLKSMATSLSVKAGQKLDHREMEHIADKLRYCKQPNFSLSGKATFVKLAAELISTIFKQQSVK